jgi:3'-phosphoadenosine 5'-phosphosulfate sulfotransferase (PAPS reductase)/FAD synthetase
VKTVLSFSGGKDSLACLYLLEQRWDELTVAWVNTGAAFPETLRQMEEIRALVPSFIEVKSQQSIDTEGYPVDVLPISATAIGHQIDGPSVRKFQSRYACCSFAVWVPMYRAMKELGATVVIRGQKHADVRKSPIESGQVIDGIRYEFPINDWSNQDVNEYLMHRGIELPANYRHMRTGLDCWNCTAYLDENAGKFDYMRQHHPEKHAIVQNVLADLQHTLHRDLAPLREIKASYQ